MNNKAKSLKNYKELEITMAEFLYNYCCCADQNFFKTTHDDLKRLLPELQRVSFTTANSNSELLYTGELILIRDCKNNVVPYINPFRNGYDNIVAIEEELTKQTVKKKDEKFDVKKISNYKLKVYLRMCKNSHNVGKYKVCRLLKQEISLRGITTSGAKKKQIERIRKIDWRKEYD